MTTDYFGGHSIALDSPISSIVQITKSDTDLVDTTRGIILSGNDGVVKLKTKGDDDVELTLLSGIVYPFRIKQVFVTGTDTGVTVFGLY